MRSRSLEILRAETIWRRSTAMGWRSASRRTTSWLDCSSSSSTLASSRTTLPAASASRLTRASTAACSCISTRPPIWPITWFNRFNSSSNDLTVCSATMSDQSSTIARAPGSAEAPGDVFLGPLVLGVGEYRLGDAVFNQLPEIHEGGEVRRPRRLLHVVRDDDDAVVG